MSYAKKRYTPAQLDAMREARAARRLEREVEYPASRTPGLLVLEVNGQRVELDLQPDPHDCRRWRAYKDGAPYLCGGLERIWRKVQVDITPLLGHRNLG